MKEDIKILEEQTRLSVKCKYCNHSNFFPVFLDKKLCNWCNKMIINNTKEHFIYKIRKEKTKNGK